MTEAGAGAGVGRKKCWKKLIVKMEGGIESEGEGSHEVKTEEMIMR
jgi:hypothetical protein